MQLAKRAWSSRNQLSAVSIQLSICEWKIEWLGTGKEKAES
jgi:hypothetical protein